MNLNPIDFNYIDGENVYPLQDYIDDKINQNNIYNLMSSNIIMNDNSKLNNCLYYSDGDLIINNSNSLKNILFKTSYLNANPSLPIPAKIDFIGKLQVYHDYNILQPTFPAGYYDVEGEIMALKADGINTDAQITILEAGIVLVQQEITDLTIALNLLEGQLNTVVDGVIFNNNFDSFKNTIESSGITAVRDSYGSLMTELQLNATSAYSMSIAQGTVYSVAIGLAGGLLAWGASAIYYNYASNSLVANPSITDAEKITIYNENIIKQKDLYSNYDVGLSNLNIVNGFINTNVLTSQLIPKINTNEITLNGYLIENVLLPRAGGSLTGSISIDRSTIAIPSVGYFGGTGDRIIFYQGSPSVYPFSIGISSGSLWCSVPDLCTHDWYINGVKTMTLNNNDFILSGGVPNLRLTTTNGNNLGYATANGYFSLSALAGDVVLRANNNLILQSKGGGSAALTIDKVNNYVNINTRLTSSDFYYKGTELDSKIASLSKTTILSSTPNVSKKYMFQFTCSTSILMPDNKTYYKYDIDLRNYTQLKYIPNPNTPYRIFKIKLWMANGYFEYLYQNNKYNVLSYEVYMSNQSQAGGGGMGSAGINIRAFGFPENNDLKSITSTQIILVRTSDFNYLSCLSIFNTALINAVIEDVLF